MRGHNIIKENGNREVDIANCVSGIEVIKNNIEARCRVLRGELLYNVILGIPLKAEKEDIDLAVANIISTTQGVTDIQELRSNLRDNVYTASIKVLANNTVVEVEI